MVSMSPALLVAIDENTPHPDKTRVAEIFAVLDVPVEPQDFTNPKELELILKLDQKELMYRGAYLRVMAIALAIEGEIVAYHCGDGAQGDRKDLAFVGLELWQTWVCQDSEIEARRERFNGQV